MKMQEMFKSFVKKLTFKKTKQALLAGASLLALTCAVVPGINNAQIAKSAGTPRFNFLAGDFEMLRGSKTTDSTWGDPVNAAVGDRVAVLFYYHNGQLETVAHHTTLRVDIPVQVGTSLKMTNYLWSQETAPITDTVVDGNIVGPNGLTVNLASAGRLEYVPGSSRLYADGDMSGRAIADGIATAGGIEIGDIAACWAHSGFVSFLVDVKAPAQIVMDKKVAHPGDATWQSEIVASAGDTISYSVGVRNDGQTNATNVTVTDQLPTYMNFVPGSVSIFTKEIPGGYSAPDTIFSTGISLPDVKPGFDNVVFVKYKTKIDSNIPNTQAAWILNNVAKVFMSGVEQDTAQAKVTVHTESRVLLLDKEVHSTNGWVKQSTIGLNGVIDYQITIKNNGNVDLTNVSLRDVLPVFVSYVAGSTKVDGVTVGDEVISANGLIFAKLTPGQQKVITLSGKVYGCPPVGGFTLFNTAYAKADSIAEIWDSASTVLSVAVPTLPTIH